MIRFIKRLCRHVAGPDLATLVEQQNAAEYKRYMEDYRAMWAAAMKEAEHWRKEYDKLETRRVRDNLLRKVRHQRAKTRLIGEDLEQICGHRFRDLMETGDEV